MRVWYNWYPTLILCRKVLCLFLNCRCCWYGQCQCFCSYLDNYFQFSDNWHLHFLWKKTFLLPPSWKISRFQTHVHIHDMMINKVNLQLIFLDEKQTKLQCSPLPASHRLMLLNIINLFTTGIRTDILREGDSRLRWPRRSPGI